MTDEIAARRDAGRAAQQQRTERLREIDARVWLRQGCVAFSDYLEECFGRVWSRPDGPEILAAFIAGKAAFEITRDHVAAKSLGVPPPPDNLPPWDDTRRYL